MQAERWQAAADTHCPNGRPWDFCWALPGCAPPWVLRSGYRRLPAAGWPYAETLAAFLPAVQHRLVQLLAEPDETVLPQAQLGRVTGCTMALASLTQPVGQAVYGVLFDVFSACPAGVLLGAGAVSAVFLTGAIRHETEKRPG